jgi:hypothetical protein
MTGDSKQPPADHQAQLKTMIAEGRLQDSKNRD